MQYVNVIVDSKTRLTDIIYTYSSPDDVKLGQKVKVPFGNGNRELDAYVIECNVSPDYNADKIKEIAKKYDLILNKEILDTAMWMRKRYGAKYIEGIRCFVSGINKSTQKKIDELFTAHESISGIDNRDDIVLTHEQDKALEQIKVSIEKENKDIFLIHGVTGSGKTEIYMQAIDKTLENDKTAIVLVPEIALTTQIVERFIKRFGTDKIAVLHSRLSTKERSANWHKIYKGEAKIVIGARMAVFAPLKNIGLIVLDEEHESTYKSDMTPKYDTVDIAIKRARYYNGTVLLGSATPSVTSYQRAKDGIYTLIELKERYNKMPLPNIDIVDMRKELRSGNTSIFSSKLYDKINQNLECGKQIIIFLNRRGYSNFISCRVCGEVINCDECDISMTYHKQKNALVCHYCGKTMPVPKTCPSCGSKYIKTFGIGTEQVEEQVIKYFPTANVNRLDIDTVSKINDYNDILDDFGNGNTDILVGTQLLAKGLDFKNVGLVGIISADVSLNIPDYRASERTFQLITQVAGRAGRGSEKGEVVVQTYLPDNIAIISAANNDLKNFYDVELQQREMVKYPPFTDFIVVNFISKKSQVMYKQADEFVKYIQSVSNKVFKDKVLNPKVPFKYKNKNNYRCDVLIKCPKGKRNLCIYHIENFIKKIINDSVACNIVIDVNPC